MLYRLIRNKLIHKGNCGIRFSSSMSRSLLMALILLAICCVPESEVQADAPKEVARWEFASETVDVFTIHGTILRDQAGPRPPTFPDFESNNTCIRISEGDSFLATPDPGDESPFDFANGDAISLEAWVQPESNGKSALMNIVSKGRTGNPNVDKDNQNWALRLNSDGNQFKVGFLFATAPINGSHWHRWTSMVSFTSETGWHHVAVTYEFGKPDSIRAWIDGKPTAGTWDMGGTTIEPPIVDNDEVWIGSSEVKNQFIGLLDAVVVSRGLLDDAAISNRFHRVGDAPSNRLAVAAMPDLGFIAAQSTYNSIHENFPNANRWLNEGEVLSEPTLVWMGNAMLLPRIPQRFDDWGIRDAWKAPVLLRMAADMQLPIGNHKVMLRCRGLGRLWLDGKMIAATTPVTRQSRDGEQPISMPAVPPSPGLRAHGYHQQEVIQAFSIDQDSQSLKRLVLELVVGGKGQRTETGEVLVAFQFEQDPTWLLATPAGQPLASLENQSIANRLHTIESNLAQLDDQNRREASTSMDDYWNARHENAKSLAKKLLPNAHELAVADHGVHPVDQLIAGKIKQAKIASSENDSDTAQHFQAKVLPILKDNCFRCHGEKEQGALRLNSREAALSTGESGSPAVVPGDPDASELMSQVRSGNMPPTDEGLSEEQIAALDKWIRDGAVWPAPQITDAQTTLGDMVSDEAFLRRAYFDTIGLPPTSSEARAFLQDDAPDKRKRLVHSLTNDVRTADHWMSFWQDLLAENPTLINQSMNSTGPFRWFIYDAMRDKKPLDRLVTELILLRGSAETGGSAAFALSGETDLPAAAKAHIIASGFLAIELQCAKCHDSPYHSTKQRDLYALAAMIERTSVSVPKSSRVPTAFFEKKGRESLIKVTLPPDEPIAPVWPFEHVTGTSEHEFLKKIMVNQEDSRERLAALITTPENLRFARVFANRVWHRLMGAGIVEPIHDWEGQSASHPELLDYLAYELINHGYELNHIVQIIMTSEAYAREAVGHNARATADLRFFTTPDRRRLSAEQIVDSMHFALGRAIDSEELTFVHDGQRPLGARQTLGVPRRSWMFASLNNERDRPSLALPRAQAVVDVLEAFGWIGSRQSPVNYRELDPNVLQPGVMSNSTLVQSLIRVSFDSELAKIAIATPSPDALVDEMFLRILSRFPTPAEKSTFVDALTPGFENRIKTHELGTPPTIPELPLVTWFNHLQPETTNIALEHEQRTRKGPPHDPRISDAWRTTLEDFVWSLLNHREFVWLP